jgi:hypothetical protein
VPGAEVEHFLGRADAADQRADDAAPLEYQPEWVGRRVRVYP